MNKVNRESIKQLLESEDNTTISIYIPTHRFPTSEHITEDKIRFKNLIRAAKEQLEAHGINDGIISQLIDGLENDIYANDAFWQHVTEGMAIFSSPSGVRYFHLPIECEERVSVGDAYDITPLLTLASYDKPYYLLALAVHRPVLYQGDMYGIERVKIDLPESPEKALGIDELFSNSKTVRAGGGHGPGNAPSGSHGQGDSRQAGQEERLKYLRIIDDRILGSDLIDANLPLLLTGADDEISSYRELSRAKHLLESHLGGNHTETAPHDLHELSWPLVDEELNRKERSEMLERIGGLLGTGRASADIDDISAAAKEGRVEALLAGMLMNTRDTVKDSTDLVTKLVFSEGYEKDGVASCGRTIFEQGGRIVGVLKDEVPNGASQVALYRY